MSHGPIMVTVPDLTGLSFAEASSKLADVGLSFSVNGHVHGHDVVVDQSPAPERDVPLETTTVTLTFGSPGG